MGSGLKLMEHSWMKNDFVGAFESLLVNGAPHYKSRVVWAGDYANKEDDSTITEWEENLIKAENGDEWYEKYRSHGINLYDLATAHTQVTPPIPPNKRPRYLVNHTKGEYVDKQSVPKDKDGWQIHPLPLLTCEGNLRGGGDYQSKNGVDFVGRWARDVISAEWVKKDIPKDFKKITPNFCE